MKIINYKYHLKKLNHAMRDLIRIRNKIQSTTNHLDGVMQWLCTAQDNGGEGGGVARSYSLIWARAHKKIGWLGAYPETTGYIIPTFLEYYRLKGNIEFRTRALRMAQWEIDIQMQSGAVQAATIDFPPTPAVFNTGQVLFGWASAYDETLDECYRESARKAADFLLNTQDKDGAWRKCSSKSVRPGVNIYDTRTAWGLLEVHRITGNPIYKDVAVRNLNFAISRQYSNGWFPDCCLDDNDRPLLHTIAYAMEGLFESGLYLKEIKYISSAQKAADALLFRQNMDGSLSGCFDSNWNPRVRWRCLTGEAQLSLVWFRLYEHTGEIKYFKAAQKANRAIMATQNLSTCDPGIFGGIQGSSPIWGGYGTFEFLNWAAKFFADALMIEIKLTK